MSRHHAHASVGVARALFDGLSAAERARVEAEARSEGVSALEIVRRSLDILIAASAAAAPRPGSIPARVGGRSPGDGAKDP